MEPQFAFPQDWTAPRELTRSLPRETQLTARGKFRMAMALVFLIAGLPLYFWMHNDNVESSKQNQILRAQGQEANAEITRLWRGDRGRHGLVSYAFTANGVRLRGQASVPDDRWGEVQKAGFIPVRYLPSNPAVNHPAGWEASTSPEWLPLVFPVFLAAGSAVLLWTLHRQWQLTAEGVPAAGVVTRCVRIKNGWIVRYQFRKKDGTVGTGRDRTYKKVEPGNPVCVLYRAENPQSNQVYPGCSYKVVTQ
jgi:hypothetical protein